MIIHVVKEGETMNSIADQYGVSVTRLIIENELLNTTDLIIGQTIVITFPEQIHEVQEGDTLSDIANTYGVTLLQLLRNNPFLSNREFIYPGETLVISYDNNKGKISINGFANETINRNTLRKTLPYLTYLSIFGYRILENAELVPINETEIIQLAKEYNVAPLMMISTLSIQGERSYESAYTILNNEGLMDQLINNILIILRAKGYYGLILTYLYLNPDLLKAYEIITSKLAMRIQNDGFPVFITINPDIIFQANEITFERINYSNIAQEADSFLIMNFNWGYSYGPPAPVSPIYNISEFLTYITTMIPPDKIAIGQPVIAYDWPLPYFIGVTRATSLSLDTVLILAEEVNAIIQFDELSQTPFFEYIDTRSSIPIKHIVWFVDARSIDALLTLITDYELNGFGLWNIMIYYPQMWLVINTQYEIETVLS